MQDAQIAKYKKSREKGNALQLLQRNYRTSRQRATPWRSCGRNTTTCSLLRAGPSSSTPRVSVACLVVVRVGPMLLERPLSGQPLVLLAAVRSRAVTTAAWAAASMACCVLRYRSSVAVRLRSGAAADESPARSQPTANHCLYRPPTPGCQARGWSLIALVVDACRKSL